MQLKKKHWWRTWAKALGEKAVPNDPTHSDQVAWVRTIIVLIYIITNLFIIAGILHKW